MDVITFYSDGGVTVSKKELCEQNIFSFNSLGLVEE